MLLPRRGLKRAVSNFIAFVPFRSIRQMEVNYSGLNSKSLYQILEKENRCLLFTYPIKLKLHHIRAANSPRIKFCADVFSFQSCSSLKCFLVKVFGTIVSSAVVV